MSIAKKIAGRASDGTLNLVFPEEVVDQNYMLLEVIETTRESKNVQGKDQVSRSFIFPIPSNLQVQSNMNYEQMGLGMIGAGAAGRINATGATEDVVNLLDSKFQAIQGLFGGGGVQDDGSESLAQSQLLTASTVAGATLIGGKIGGKLGAIFTGALASGAITGGGLAEGFALGERLAINPHLAVLFKGVGLREFGFQYKFVARNRQESDKLKSIIQALQYHMHPDYFAGNLAFQYPDEFKISFSQNRNAHLFDIKRSVLSSMTVNYNGEGMPIFFEDVGAPVSIEINMTFQETKIHTKRDFAEQYEIDRGEASRRNQSLQSGTSEVGAFNTIPTRDSQGNILKPETREVIRRNNQSEGQRNINRQPSAFIL